MTAIKKLLCDKNIKNNTYKSFIKEIDYIKTLGVNYILTYWSACRERVQQGLKKLIFGIGISKTKCTCKHLSKKEIK